MLDGLCHYYEKYVELEIHLSTVLTKYEHQIGMVWRFQCYYVSFFCWIAIWIEHATTHNWYAWTRKDKYKRKYHTTHIHLYTVASMENTYSSYQRIQQQQKTYNIYIHTHSTDIVHSFTLNNIHPFTHFCFDGCWWQTENLLENLHVWVIHGLFTVVFFIGAPLTGGVRETECLLKVICYYVNTKSHINLPHGHKYW